MKRGKHFELVIRRLIILVNAIQMSDKFPPLEGETLDDHTETMNDIDFLKREAEILGDEFKTEQDSALLNDIPDPEFDSFEKKHISTGEESALEDSVQLSNDFNSMKVTSNPSEAIKNWQELRNLEISARDKANIEAKKRLQEEATKYVDDFYDNYNKKKLQQLETTRAEADAFLRKRDEFFNQNNTHWDRVLQLINLNDSDELGGRDRSKFKEILLKLKGCNNAPGA